MNRISFLNRGYAFKGLLAVVKGTPICFAHCFQWHVKHVVIYCLPSLSRIIENIVV